MNNHTSDKNTPAPLIIKTGDIGHEPKSIVSRTIINKNSGTVTLFSLDKGQSLSEHTAPFDALVYITEGDIDISIGGTWHSLHGGEIILMPAGVPHALKALTKSRMLLVMINEK
jgi:quercetin dioxygenase-like cupin family protein